jgi:hypothetical protein
VEILEGYILKEIYRCLLGLIMMCEKSHLRFVSINLC